MRAIACVKTIASNSLSPSSVTSTLLMAAEAFVLLELAVTKTEKKIAEQAAEIQALKDKNLAQAGELVALGNKNFLQELEVNCYKDLLERPTDSSQPTHPDTSAPSGTQDDSSAAPSGADPECVRSKFDKQCRSDGDPCTHRKCGFLHTWQCGFLHKGRQPLTSSASSASTARAPLINPKVLLASSVSTPPSKRARSTTSLIDNDGKKWALNTH